MKEASDLAENAGDQIRLHLINTLMHEDRSLSVLEGKADVQVNMRCAIKFLEIEVEALDMILYYHASETVHLQSL